VSKAHLTATVSFWLLEECHLVNPFICSSSLEGGICLRDIFVVRICQLHRFAVTVNRVRFYLIKPAYLPSILITVVHLNYMHFCFLKVSQLITNTGIPKIH